MEFCHSFGKDSSLVVIETEQENNHLKQWLIKHGMTRDSNGISELTPQYHFHFPYVPFSPGDPDTGVWVGGSDNGHHGIWTWFATGDLIRWWDWGPGQPQPGWRFLLKNRLLEALCFSGKDQHCLYVVGGWLGYQWADFHCDFQVKEISTIALI